MPTHRLNWQEWVPGLPHPSPLLTLVEVLAMLERLGQDVDHRTLRFWEDEGVIPGPIYQSQHGMRRALYPIWLPILVCDLRILQLMRGLSLAQCVAPMRSYAFIHALLDADEPRDRQKN